MKSKAVNSYGIGNILPEYSGLTARRVWISGLNLKGIEMRSWCWDGRDEPWDQVPLKWVLFHPMNAISKTSTAAGSLCL